MNIGPVLSWFGYLVTALALLLALEVGFRISRLKRFARTSEQRSLVGGVLAALLAVLGFVLAFSFSIVESRFSARKELVLQEANAIGTTYLRTDFLPPEQRARSRELLRHYVDIRLGARMANLPSVLTETEKIHAELWRLAAQAAGQKEQSIPLGLYIASLNEVIDLHQKRLTVAVRAHLPAVFFYLLYGAALATLGVLGFSTGQTGSRNLMATLPLILVLGALLAMVKDLDRPDLRIVKVDLGAMQDLQRSLRAEPPQVP